MIMGNRLWVNYSSAIHAESSLGENILCNIVITWSSVACAHHKL